jgi:hypothetical protein
LQEVTKIAAKNQQVALVVAHSQPLLDPSPDGVSMLAIKSGHFLDCIATVKFGSTRVGKATSHYDAFASRSAMRSAMKRLTSLSTQREHEPSLTGLQNVPAAIRL